MLVGLESWSSEIWLGVRCWNGEMKLLEKDMLDGLRNVI